MSLIALASLLLVSASRPMSASILAQGSREDKDGWIVLHLAGSPYEVGFQHGSLAAAEIHDTVKTFSVAATAQSSKDWKWYRETAHKMFWPKLDEEYRQEITGIAAGLRQRGFQEDADDILALNAYIEIQGYYLPALEARERHAQIVSHAPTACSAFVATGSATKDGKIVMAHNFWWDYLTGEHWKVILDIRPSKGHHLMMDAAPGFIESGTDWAINDKGIAMCETTIGGFTGFDERGIPEFERMRKAIQYSESLDDVAHIFKLGNNGGYANAWLLADAKTNEIGKLELGLKNVIFSSTNDGYYFGANFPEDAKLIREETPGYREDPNGKEDRKARWKKVLSANKGKIDAAVARGFMEDTYDAVTGKNDGHGGGALCAKGGGGGAINAKVVTGDELMKMQFWARMGVPDGSDLKASDIYLPDSGKAVFLDLKGEPWTVISSESR